MICEVVNFKEEGLVTLEGGEGEKGILIINLSMQKIEPQSPVQRSVKTEMVCTKIQMKIFFGFCPGC